jgi:hypothetical protein
MAGARGARDTSVPGFVPGIDVLARGAKNVDGRDVGAKRSFVASPGHDDVC